ncbi:MAG: ATP-binding protein [Candidatus Micrarchaeota archaeon]
MLHNLIDRESEWRFLEDTFKGKKGRFIVIYGRRRVGKSYLTSQFIDEKKGIYYLCSKGNEKEQLELLSNKFAGYFNDLSLTSRPFSKWHDFFTYITEKAKEKTIVLEFDEFPFLIAANPAITSIFQKYWDESLSKLDVYLILCGSSVSMMETEVLGYRSPLYGRRTGQWKLQPLRFKNVLDFFGENALLERIIEIYAITGGVPYYLVSLDLKKPAIENTMAFIAKKGSPLLEEGEALIREEFPEAMTYFSIMHGIAKGKTKQSDIANHVGIPATALTRYLKNLQRLGFIVRVNPVTEKERSKKSLYFISDNFMDFWFKFIYPNKSYIEEEDYGAVEKILRSEFDSYMGFVFEQICIQVLEELRKKGKINFDKIGSWWGAHRREGERKTDEIDIISLNEKTDSILFGECKWKNNVSPDAVLDDLKEKATSVEWRNSRREEYFAIFAKSFKNKHIRQENVFLFDLNDLEKILRPSLPA